MGDIQTTGRRREVGAELKRIRKQTNLPAYKVAANLGWTASHISRSEAGKRRVTDVDAGHYLGICGAGTEQLQELLKIVNEPDDYRLQVLQGRIPDEVRTLTFFESTAATIHSFEPIYIPGVAQTPDYARALLQELAADDPEQIEHLVRIRMKRGEVLAKSKPPRCMYFIHENALRMPIGGPRVMSEQLLHLLLLGNRPECAIRVVPVSAGARGAASGTFQIFGFKEDPAAVYLQHDTTSEFLETPEEVARCQGILKRIATVALDGPESREFLANLASDFERQGDVRHGDRVRGRLAQEQL
jgi:transcriptional regulator with XRE-family HTH domain